MKGKGIKGIVIGLCCLLVVAVIGFATMYFYQTTDAYYHRQWERLEGFYYENKETLQYIKEALWGREDILYIENDGHLVLKTAGTGEAVWEPELSDAIRDIMKKGKRYKIAHIGIDMDDTYSNFYIESIHAVNKTMLQIGYYETLPDEEEALWDYEPLEGNWYIGSFAMI